MEGIEIFCCITLWKRSNFHVKKTWIFPMTYIQSSPWRHLNSCGRKRRASLVASELWDNSWFKYRGLICSNFSDFLFVLGQVSVCKAWVMSWYLPTTLVKIVWFKSILKILWGHPWSIIGTLLKTYPFKICWSSFYKSWRSIEFTLKWIERVGALED